MDNKELFTEVIKDIEDLLNRKTKAYNDIFDFLSDKGIQEQEQIKFKELLNNYTCLQIEFMKVKELLKD